MSVFDHLQNAAVKQLMANIPPETLEQVQQIGHFLLSVGARLDRIEQRQRMIMDHLGINHGDTDARQSERPVQGRQ